MNATLDAAYQRLLKELCRRLGAARAELQLLGNADMPARTIVQDDARPVGAGAHAIAIPIREGAHDIGRLHMVFASSAPLPDPAEQELAQTMVELAALLVEEHHQLSWGVLRQASRRILSVAEEELQRIVLDIHDGPVQKLFALSSHLALLQAQLGDTPPEARATLEPTVQRATMLIEGALQDIRVMLSGLRMAEFHQRSLPDVLEELAFQHETLTSNHVALEIAGAIPPVSMPVKIALYRVMQEGLSNAYRHANVDRHAVRVSSHDGWVELEVADQGRGFEPPPLEGPGATEREEHIGLRGMRERMHLVGGQLRVISQPGQGTRVIVQVPSDA
ncbi:histidine kinase [Kouleothrix aurantiaca]|uniref:histidine kinase n=1 Tax=Kouleothrix aurantiaca TaxID=186479 RepID=A0A0P9DI03_9CHLR|nr:histidine kinase [Kouleothrix aurantiaca]